MESDLAEYPGCIHFAPYTVKARRDYRLALAGDMTIDEAVNGGPPILRDDELNKRVFWGALALLDKERTTIEALLALEPGCEVDDLDAHLFTLVIEAILAHVSPKKRAEPSPLKSETTLTAS